MLTISLSEELAVLLAVVWIATAATFTALGYLIRQANEKK